MARAKSVVSLEGGPLSVAENSRSCDHGQVRGVNSANRKPDCRCRGNRDDRALAFIVAVCLHPLEFIVLLLVEKIIRSPRIFDRFGFLTLLRKGIRLVCKLLSFHFVQVRFRNEC